MPAEAKLCRLSLHGYDLSALDQGRTAFERRDVGSLPSWCGGLRIWTCWWNGVPRTLWLLDGDSDEEVPPVSDNAKKQEEVVI